MTMTVRKEGDKRALEIMRKSFMCHDLLYHENPLPSVIFKTALPSTYPLVKAHSYQSVMEHCVSTNKTVHATPDFA